MKTRPISRELILPFAFLALVGLLLPTNAQAAARTWADTGTDFNTAANWTGGVPGSNDVGLFSGTTPPPQPNLSASLTIAGLRFAAGASGYDLTSTGGAVLTLNGVNTTGSSGTTTASASAIRNDNTTGTTTINAPLNLAPSTLISTIFQDAGDGSTLILNGVISETGSVALSLKNGTIELNNANTYSGGTTIDAAGTIVVVGNDSGLGTGTYTNNNSSTLQAGGGARVLANNFAITGADMTISGTNNLTINGSFTGGGAGTRTLTVNNSGTTTLGGSVFLAESNAVSRTLVVNGTGATTISGAIANNSGANTLASNLSKGGAGTLTVSGANTYTGTTSITAGTLLANSAATATTSSTGTGAVTITGSGILGGTGTVGNTGGTATVTVGPAATGGGTIAPGASVGQLTLNANTTFTGVTASFATLLIELSGATADKLVINGNLNLSSAFDKFDLSLLASPTLPSYQVVTYTGTLSGTFNDVSSLPSGYSLDYSNPNEINLLTPVPEPSTWIAAFLAVAAIGWQQRRRLLARVLS